MPRKDPAKLKAERAIRRSNVARAIDLTWSSLRTHLADGVKVPPKKHKNNHEGNEEWHARCAREYAEVLYSLSVELHELTKIDFPSEYEAMQKSIPQ